MCSMSTLKDLVQQLAAFMPALFIVLVLGAVSVALVTAPQLPPGSFPAAVLPGAVFSLTNSERTDEGVAPLTRNSKLDRAAQMKAEDMAEKGYYAHVSPEGLTPMHWVDRAGYSYLMVGENLVVNRDSAREVVDAFMGSSGHRTNILRSDFTEIGVGVAQGTYKNKDATFIVQIFAKPRAFTPVPAPAPKKSTVLAVAKSVPPPAPRASVVPEKKELVKEVAKAVAPIISALQATTTTAVLAPTTTPEAFEPIFSVSIPDPIELSYPDSPVVMPLSWQERLRDSAAALWTKVSGLWKSS